MGSLPTLPPITLGTLETAVFERLGGGVYWISDEIDSNIREAIRFWNAATRFWRRRVQFQTVASQPFYDLSTTTGTSAYLGYSILDQTLVKSMEHHLLEPPTPTVWTGTVMFSLDEFTQALERRRNQFLIETGAVLTRYTPALTPTGDGRIQLQDSILDFRRAAFNDGTTNYTLFRDDEWRINAMNAAWIQTPGIPGVYSVSVTPPFAMQLSPPAANFGTLDLIVVNSGATLNPATGVAMGVPDDFAWVVMWGALADLVGENGPAADPMRAQYAEQRWRDGISMAKGATTVIQAQVNNVPLQVVSVYEADTFNPSWQNQTGPPAVAMMAGLNLIALSPVPDGVYSITADIVQNAPAPTLSTDQVLVSRDVADVLVDYAQHVSAFKEGGAEFADVMQVYERIMRLADVYRKRMGAQTRDHKAMMDRPRVEFYQRPMEVEATTR